MNRLTITRTTPEIVKILITACIIAGIVACTSPTGGPTKGGQTSSKQENTITQLILSAQHSLEPIRSTDLLQASELLANYAQWSKAFEALKKIDSSALSPVQLSSFGTIYTLTTIELGLPNHALDWLEENTALTAQNTELLKRQAQAYQATLQPIEQTRSRIKQLAITTDEQEQLQLSDAIWTTIIQIPSSRIETAVAQVAKKSELAGWLSLALIAKNTTGTLENTQVKIEAWKTTWPAHTAAQIPPASLVQLLSLKAPEKIAVLIPLSGSLRSAGNSIRDGIIAAHMGSTDNRITTLEFYDTNLSRDIYALYLRALTDGATAVIGPLTKSNLEQLEKSPNLSVQTLALNSSENNINNSNLSKLGLSANDDALLASTQALNAGLKRAIVIQSQKSWSIRAADTFVNNWEGNNASIAIRTSFTDTAAMSNTIKAALNLQQSEARTKYLEDVLGQLVESDSYRRKDVDSVFIATNSAEARSLKPILAFHFAGDLPVYATNQINNGASSYSKDMDLSGIYFGETPWAISQTSTPITNTIKNHIRRGSGFSKNLYALGIDAYHVSQRLPLLNETNNYNLQGFTGALTRDANGNISREPNWASFSRGKIKAEEKTYLTLRKEAKHEHFNQEGSQENQ